MDAGEPCGHLLEEGGGVGGASGGDSRHPLHQEEFVCRSEGPRGRQACPRNPIEHFFFVARCVSKQGSHVRTRKSSDSAKGFAVRRGEFQEVEVRRHAAFQARGLPQTGAWV